MILLRLLAFAADLALGFVLSRWALNIPAVFELYLNLPAAPLLAALAFTWPVRFYGTLMLGVSPGQFCCGLRSQERFGGGLRVLLDVSVVSMLPFRGKSLGEKWSATTLRKSDSPGASLLMGVALPTCAVLAALSPLLQNPGGGGVFSREGLGRGDGERLISLPTLEVLRQDSTKTLTGRIDLFTPEGDWRASVRKLGHFDPWQAARIARAGNPLFAQVYPELAKDGPLDWREFEALLADSLSLNLANLMGHAITCGPFLIGHADLRFHLIGTLGEGISRQAGLVSLKKRKFLFFRLRRGDVYVQNVVPLAGERPAIFQFIQPDEQELGLIKHVFRRQDWPSFESAALHKRYLALLKDTKDEKLRERLLANLADLGKLTDSRRLRKLAQRAKR